LPQAALAEIVVSLRQSLFFAFWFLLRRAQAGALCVKLLPQVAVGVGAVSEWGSSGLALSDCTSRGRRLRAVILLRTR